ncbi:MAG: regulatory signaling modulator protein AmpE [Gammaproteobacteria bacterium]|nr:MAG: regulatory signaling modulator protein AmpE [Gammaproteobacteria bacterium]
MRFVIVLLAYFFHRRYQLALTDHLDRKIESLLERAGRSAPLSPHSAWGWVVLPVLLLSIAFQALDALFFGVVTLALNIFVLVACMGSTSLRPAIEAYIDAGRRDDWQSAWRYLEAAGLKLEASTRNEESLNRQVADWYVQESFGLYFLVTFWFMLLGAPGALFARFIWVATRHGQANWDALSHVVYWIPVRLMALGLGLVGNFMGMLQASISDLIDPQARWERVLANASKGAAEGLGQTGNQAKLSPVLHARQLINYAFLAWLVGLALLTLVGTIG